METFNSATNLYDQALAESVMDSLDFDYDDHMSWVCVQYVAFSCYFFPPLIANLSEAVLVKSRMQWPVN
jgi:hypothetical protein